MLVTGAITIGIDPEIDLGPVSVAWHGIGIAAGIAAGGWLASRFAVERGLSRERLVNLVVLIALAGIVGSRLFFLAEEDPGAFVSPAEWLGTRGYSFYGAMLLGVAAVAFALWRLGFDRSYLDALAAGFPLGIAVGRIGDVINGEHHGGPSDAPWAIRYTHPDAEVPATGVAYHSGGLYEVVLGLAMLAVIWPLRHRFKAQTQLLWVVVAAYAAGRFVIFFFRDDSDEFALGLTNGHWTSLALIAVALAAAAVAGRRRRPIFRSRVRA
jgi:phosphatidylglycerol:prolipoprotein diacylglycerol transferase